MQVNVNELLKRGIEIRPSSMPLQRHKSIIHTSKTNKKKAAEEEKKNNLTPNSGLRYSYDFTTNTDNTNLGGTFNFAPTVFDRVIEEDEESES